MKNAIFRLLLLCCMLLPVVGFAQQYTSTNKKAIKAYEKAQQAYNQRNDDVAEAALKVAIDKDPSFIEAHMLLGDIYIDAGKVDEGIGALRKAIEINPDFYPANFFFLAELEYANADYESALPHYKTLLTYPKLDPKMEDRARFGVESCILSVNSMRNPVEFKPENMGQAINTELPEYFPCITADDHTLMFTRRLNDQRTITGYNEDFFIATKRAGKWQLARSVGSPINTINNEGAPTLAPDGATVVFTACAGDDGYGKNRVGLGSCDLFLTRRQGQRWTPPINLGSAINSVRWETQPSLSADGRTLYFIRGSFTRSGVKGQDIYVSHRDEQGKWTKAEPLGNTINTPGREVSVHIHPDGRTLYFASDGHPGLGGLDLFVSRKDSNGNWQTPINLGYPINTNRDENSLLVGANGEVAYFASDRDGGKGELDLYTFTMPPHLRPAKVTYMQGRVHEKGTKNPIGAKFELVDVATGELVASSVSDRSTGEFVVCLPANREYALSVEHPDYLFWSEHFSLKKPASAKRPYIKDVPLSKPVVGEVVVLKNVFFETAKYDLKPTSTAELDFLTDYLTKNRS